MILYRPRAAPGGIETIARKTGLLSGKRGDSDVLTRKRSISAVRLTAADRCETEPVSGLPRSQLLLRRWRIVGQAEVPRQGGRNEQPGIGHQAAVVEGDLDPVGVVAPLLFWDRFFAATWRLSLLTSVRSSSNTSNTTESKGRHVFRSALKASSSCSTAATKSSPRGLRKGARGSSRTWSARAPRAARTTRETYQVVAALHRAPSFPISLPSLTRCKPEKRGYIDQQPQPVARPAGSLTDNGAHPSIDPPFPACL